MHPLPHRYHVALTYRGDKTGALTTDGQPTIGFSAPKEFDGPGSGWSPETLLLNAVAACVTLTFGAIAAMMQVEYRDLTIEATGTVDKIEGGKQMHFSEITLRPTLRLANPADESKLPKMWESTEKHCLVSNSLKTPVHIAAPTLR
ncbi:MAG: OsmC family protein [Deltaproteobacteria bacterium]|nr:OsmC family protein [Deltaproteobacteria bacterium]